MGTTETAQANEYDHGSNTLTDSRLVGLWGAIVAAGWLVSQLVAIADPAAIDTATGITAFWLVGSLVPIGASFYWMRKHGFSGLFPTWTLLGVTGIVLSFGVALGVLGISDTLIYGSLWFAGPAVGFLVTAFYMVDWSKWLYAGAAVANLVGAAAVVLVPGFEAVYFAVAAVIQGGPMLYHSSRLD